VDAIATLVGAAAIRDRAYKNLNVEKVLRSRSSLKHQLERLEFQVWPSEGNFLLVRSPQQSALELQRSLKNRGVLVRHFNVPGVEDKLRITVGTDEQNEFLCRLLKDLDELE
jgi:histidinol-phosphate aminotransferase